MYLSSLFKGPQGFQGPPGEPGEPGAAVSIFDPFYLGIVLKILFVYLVHLHGLHIGPHC